MGFSNIFQSKSSSEKIYQTQQAITSDESYSMDGFIDHFSRFVVNHKDVSDSSVDDSANVEFDVFDGLHVH